MKPIIPLIAAAALSLGMAPAIHAQPAHDAALQLPDFDRVDADSDGQISRDEAAAAGLDFNWEEVDGDGTGYLTPEEYDHAVGADAGDLLRPGNLDTDPTQPEIR